jgi:hypothetical protein
MAQVPWGTAQNLIGPKPVVLLGFFVRLLFTALQEEMHGQHAALIEELVRVLPGGPQEATDRVRQKIDAPP